MLFAIGRCQLAARRVRACVRARVVDWLVCDCIMAEFVDGQRPRRHLPSPALARARSRLKLQQFASFDVSELGLRGSGGDDHAMLGASFPPALVLSTAASGGGGRRLPVPGVKSTSWMDLSRSAVRRMDSDAGESMVKADSGPASPLDFCCTIRRDSPKLSQSRKLPAPPCSSTAVLGAARRLLPRPQSCDVPCLGEGDDLSCTRATTGSGWFTQRPLSFDLPESQHSQPQPAAPVSPSLRLTVPHAGSDPSLQHHHGKIQRQMSMTGSCPTLPRSSVSPRPPPHAGASIISSLPAFDAAFNESIVAVASVPKTPSPALSPHPFLRASEAGSGVCGGVGLAMSGNNLVLMPSASSAFRLVNSQRQLSLPPSCAAAADLGAAYRRNRFYEKEASSSFSNSFHESCISSFCLGIQRSSRSRQAFRHIAR